MNSCIIINKTAGLYPQYAGLRDIRIIFEIQEKMTLVKLNASTNGKMIHYGLDIRERFPEE